MGASSRSPRDDRDTLDEVHPTIVAKHVVFGLEPSMTAYRRGCRCTQCKAVNSERMRQWRKKRDADQHPDRYVETPPAEDDPIAAPTLIRIDRLPPGKVTTALVEELPAVDGASPFQRTIKEMMLKSALVIDNADVLDRLDLLNSMQIRVRDGIHMLNPASKPATTGSLEEELGSLGAP